MIELTVRSQREEKLLQEIIETSGIKKIAETFDDETDVESDTTTASGDKIVHETPEGKRYVVSLIFVWNTSGADRSIYFKFEDGSSRFKKKLADKSGTIINMINNRWKGPEDKDFIINTDGTNVEYTVFGKEE